MWHFLAEYIDIICPLIITSNFQLNHLQWLPFFQLWVLGIEPEWSVTAWLNDSAGFLGRNSNLYIFGVGLTFLSGFVASFCMWIDTFLWSPSSRLTKRSETMAHFGSIPGSESHARRAHLWTVTMGLWDNENECWQERCIFRDKDNTNNCSNPGMTVLISYDFSFHVWCWIPASPTM